MDTTLPATSAGFDRATVRRARGWRCSPYFLWLASASGYGRFIFRSSTIRLYLDPALLGLALLTIGIGAVVPMPIVSVVAARFGTRHVTIAAALLFAVALPLPILAPDVTFLFVACALFEPAMGPGISSRRR
jgi:predicted MFS family arabinose efflux permease